MLPRGFVSSIAAESLCRWASNGLLPLRFAIQGYCWWNSRFRYGSIAIRNNYLRDFTSHHFAQVNGRLHGTGSRFRLLHLDADVQLEAPVPHEHARSNVVRQDKRQDEGRVAFAHRQHHAPLVAVDGLGGPLDRIEPLRAPGILHAHLGMLPAQGARGLDRAEEGAEN